MKTILLIFSLLFSLQIIIGQEKSNDYTNLKYAFSIINEEQSFEKPSIEEVGSITTFRFYDLHIEVTVQPKMDLEEAKKSIMHFSSNRFSKERGETSYDGNKYIQIVENGSGKTAKLLKILSNNNFTYFISIFRPKDIEEGFNQLRMFKIN